MLLSIAGNIYNDVALVVDDLSDNIEEIYDGVIRRRSDMIKAISLGARACMAGQLAHFYGLGAELELDIDGSINLLKEEINPTLALLGRPAINGLNCNFISVNLIKNRTFDRQ